LQQFRGIKSPTKGSDQLTEKLMESRFFREAHEVWTSAHCATCQPASFVNGSFEDDVDMGNRTFGWQIAADISGLTPSVDTGEHQDGARSLRLDFNGNTNPQPPLLSQIVTVDRGGRYRVSFDALTKSFVSAGTPMVRVVDASSESNAPLGEAVLRSDSSGWQQYSIDFAAGPDTRAVRIMVARTNCPNNSCAAFGTVWFDSFALARYPQF
jgi:hypothetical protein